MSINKKFLLLLALLLVVSWLAPLPFEHYELDYMPLWLHTTLEMFSIVVALLSFAVTWNSQKSHRQGYLLLLAAGFLAVGLIDFMHLLSVKGMPDFVTPSGVEKGTNFWLVARFMAALSLTAVAWASWNSLSNPRNQSLLIFGSILFVLLISWLGLFQQHLWPRTYIEGYGLTPLKIYTELIIVAILALGSWGFVKHKLVHSSVVSGHLFMASSITILSELFFISFATTHDLFYLLGHVYKLIAYLYLYQAVFISSIQEPFQDLKDLQRKLESSETTLQSIIDNVPVRIFWKDRELRFMGANKLFVEDAGAASKEELLGKSDREYFPNHRELYTTDDEQIMTTGQPKLNYEEPLKTASGDDLWVQTSKVPLRNSDDDIIGVLATYTDITERKQAEQTIAFQANYDELTKLPNRRLFQDRLDQQTKHAIRHGTRLALLLLDLDDFKEVNDSLGHSAGDELLCNIAARLQDCMRQTDTVARLGGDEFIVLLSDLSNDTSALEVAEKILAALAKPMQLQNQVLHLTVSIGITLFPDDTESLEDLLKNVDQAMYSAKQQGRNQYKFFTKSMHLAAQQRLKLTQDLRIAIAEGQFRLAYQPIVEMDTGRIVKAETLIRWQHPEHGIISPAQFIPLAESTGLIVDIGDWVFFEAARQCKQWRKSIASDFQISINKSPIQFTHKKSSTDSWFDYLDKLDLPGESICIEITEGLILDASSTVQQRLVRYRDAGLKIYLDDFGTGYSSLAYIKKFDIDCIKIDRSFVNSICESKDDRALCEAIIEMAHKLEIEVVAEGVETAEQHAILVGAGCNYGQGYFYSPPVYADRFEESFKSPISPF